MGKGKRYHHCMNKRFIPACVLLAYVLLLIKIMVLKDMPLVRVGSLMLNFGGTATGPANFLPFKTIFPYLMGDKGWIIAGINLAGNIVLLLPIGFLIPLVFRNITWKKSLTLAVATGLSIEVLQVILHVGIFDVDDVILNGLGVMMGFWVSVLLAKMAPSSAVKNTITTIIIALVAVATLGLYGLSAYEKSQPENSGLRVRNEQEGAIPQGRDPCGGTGGIGQIIGVENNTLTVERRDGVHMKVNLTAQTAVATGAGPVSASTLRKGNRVTLVGGPNPDGSFAAEAIFVCNVPGEDAQ